MKIRLRERKRWLSVLLAVVITLTSVLSVVGINVIVKGLTKAAELDKKPIVVGDTAESPSSIESYFGTATISSKDTLSDCPKI